MIVGLAWAMGADGTAQRVAAVVGARLLVRSAEQVWRAGTYGTVAEADAAAVRWTRELEEQGMDLVAGPTEFSTPAMSTRMDRALQTAICRVLRLGGEAAPAPVRSASRADSDLLPDAYETPRRTPWAHVTPGPLTDWEPASWDPTGPVVRDDAGRFTVLGMPEPLRFLRTDELCVNVEQLRSILDGKEVP